MVFSSFHFSCIPPFLQFFCFCNYFRSPIQSPLSFPQNSLSDFFQLLFSRFPLLSYCSDLLRRVTCFFCNSTPIYVFRIHIFFHHPSTTLVSSRRFFSLALSRGARTGLRLVNSQIRVCSLTNVSKNPDGYRGLCELKEKVFRQASHVPPFLHRRVMRTLKSL